MSANNKTSATQAKKPVAESVEVILAQIHGLIEKDGKGVFRQTDKGKTLETLLEHTDPLLREELVREFLEI